MNPSEHNPERQRLDEATSRRLAKLRDVPFDVSRLREAVEAEAKAGADPAPARAAAAGRWKLPAALKTVRAAAASLLVLGLVLVAVLTWSSGPVLASADKLARIHEDVVAGRGHSTPVGSFDAASASLAAKWPEGPPVPKLPGDHVVSCCVHAMGRTKAACVAFQSDGVPVTMAVARAGEVRPPQASQTLNSGGTAYRVQSEGDLNMVMIERDGRWVCLMGRLPASRLAELAGALRF